MWVTFGWANRAGEESRRGHPATRYLGHLGRRRNETTLTAKKSNRFISLAAVSFQGGRFRYKNVRCEKSFFFLLFVERGTKVDPLS